MSGWVGGCGGLCMCVTTTSNIPPPIQNLIQITPFTCTSPIYTLHPCHVHPSHIHTDGQVFLL